MAWEITEGILLAFGIIAAAMVAIIAAAIWLIARAAESALQRQSRKYRWLAMLWACVGAVAGSFAYTTLPDRWGEIGTLVAVAICTAAVLVPLWLFEQSEAVFQRPDLRRSDHVADVGDDGLIASRASEVED